MNDNKQIKISDEELQNFNKLAQEIQKNIFEFGELYLEKMELDDFYRKLVEKESSLRKNIETLKTKESDLINSILNKYGEGAIDITNGVFIPNTK